MLKLLKSIFTYHKISFIIGFGFIFLLNLILIISGDWYEAQDDFPGMRVVWFAPISILFIIFITKLNIEGRIRIYGILPLNRYNIALSKLAIVPLFWSTVLLLHLIIYLIMMFELPAASWFFDNLSYSGIIIIFNSVPLIYADLISISDKPIYKVALTSAWSLIMIALISYIVLSLPYLSHLSPDYIGTMGEKFTTVYLSAEGSIIFLLVGLFISISSVFVFLKKRSYLE